jgi:hypothetical protein
MEELVFPSQIRIPLMALILSGNHQAKSENLAETWMVTCSTGIRRAIWWGRGQCMMGYEYFLLLSFLIKWEVGFAVILNLEGASEFLGVGFNKFCYWALSQTN